MTADSTSSRMPEVHGGDRARFEAEILPGDAPVLLRGVASAWPAVARRISRTTSRRNAEPCSAR
jgi:hypothetical protein